MKQPRPASVICPDHHYLEAWGDAEPVNGSYSLQQPCIHPFLIPGLFRIPCSGGPDRRQTYEDLLKFWWEDNIAPRKPGQGPGLVGENPAGRIL